SSIFWGLCLFGLAWTGIALVRDRCGRILLGVVVTGFLLLVLIFTCTDCFRWLENQATVHRSMMQLSPIAVVAATYGLWLKRAKSYTVASSQKDVGFTG